MVSHHSIQCNLSLLCSSNTQLFGLLQYPFDEILIYSTSLGIVIPFIVTMLALHYAVPDSKKFWSHASLIFVILYAVFVTANYVVQLATVIPKTLQGKLDEVRVLQQLPHSLFWDFDALGYIFMGLACFTASRIFENKGFNKWVRVSLLANAAVTPLITIVYFYPTYSYNLLILGFPWAITAPMFMLMLALWFRRNNSINTAVISSQSFTSKVKTIDEENNSKKAFQYESG